MRRLKPLILLLVTVAFIASCTKTIEPPALGDNTLNTGDPDNNQKDAKAVLSLGTNVGDIFRTGPKGILYVRNKTKVISIYKPNDDGIFGDANPFPGDPWDASASIFYMGLAQGVQTVMVANVPPAGLFRFDVNEDGFLDMHPTTNAADPWPTNFGFWYGDGWDNFDIIAFNEKFVFQISHNQGEALLRSDFQEFTDDWSTWNRSGTLQREETGISLGGYRSAMAMGNSLLVVNEDGDLMSYAVDDDGNLDNGKKIGIGWKAYDRVVATGNDILALNSKGDVYRYAIDLTKTDNNAE